MINRILHALSNRTVFNEPLFVADPSFIPAVLSIRDQDFRAQLLLDITTTDYYLRAYLGILEGYPDLKAQFNDVWTSYKISDFLPRGVVMDGAELASVPAVGGFFTDPPNPSLPIALTYLIDYTNTDQAKITAVETGNVWAAPAAVFQNAAGPILQITWPPGVPFSGILQLNQNWQPEARIVIAVTPSQFPYTLVLQRCLNSPYLTELLALYGMSDAFYNSFEPTEQLAIILTVLGLNNPAINIIGNG